MIGPAKGREMHNFYSDTQTKPTPAMLATVMDAEVGDEQRFEDPTTIRLERRVADLLGKEAAVFLPSGSDVQRDRHQGSHGSERRGDL